MSFDPTETANGTGDTQSKRRHFLVLTTGTVAAVGTGLALWPFLKSMQPAADVRAAASIEVDLKPIEPGQRLTVKWRSRPLFIVRRTPDEVARARADDDDPDLIDPATDASRVKRAEWLIVIGVCTHLGCIPLGQKSGDPLGLWGGWFCPCHGSHYDTAGRIRKGPAPRNLYLPPYAFLANGVVKIG